MDSGFGLESMPHFSGLQASRFTLCPAIGSRGVSENTLTALVARLRSLLRCSLRLAKNREPSLGQTVLIPAGLWKPPAKGVAGPLARIGRETNGLSVLRRSLIGIAALHRCTNS